MPIVVFIFSYSHWTLFCVVEFGKWLIQSADKIEGKEGEEGKIPDCYSLLIPPSSARCRVTRGTNNGLASDKWNLSKNNAIPIQKKGNAKECSNYHTISLISHASKAMLKILQARLQHYVTQELPDVQVGFEKAEEPEIKLATYVGS